MQEYTKRLTSSKTKPSEHLTSYFQELVHAFGVDTPPSPVIEISDSTVYFRPLLVESGNHVSAQGACFATLVRHWRSTSEPIELLVIEVADATMERIRQCMKGVTVSDVTRGIRIWETLPCRIKKIVVYTPTNMPVLNWTMRRMMRLCLSTKLVSKIHISQQPNGHMSQKWNPDADGDVSRCVLEDAQHLDAL